MRNENSETGLPVVRAEDLLCCTLLQRVARSSSRPVEKDVAQLTEGGQSGRRPSPKSELTFSASVFNSICSSRKNCEGIEVSQDHGRK